MATIAEKKEYITVLLKEVKTTQLLLQVTQALEQSVQEIYYHPDLFKRLTDTTVPAATRQGLLEDYLRKSNLTLIWRNFLQMLQRRELLSVLDDQDKPTFFTLFHEAAQSLVTVGLTVPDYLSDYLINWIHTELEDLLNYPFVLEVQVEPSILGGLIIQADRFLFDDTIQYKLGNIENIVRNRIHEITAKHLDAAIAQDFGALKQTGGKQP
jgi:F-type H+-transporting ATPase subunit delta